MVEELTARGQRVGIICVGRAEGPAFTDVDASLLRGACTAAALAVSNATLYRIQAGMRRSCNLRRRDPRRRCIR